MGRKGFVEAGGPQGSLARLGRPSSGRKTGLPRAEERRLVAAARRGDRAAMKRLLEALSGPVYRFGQGFCRNPDDAQDLMQDVLATLVTRLDGFRGDASLSTWAFVVARNACARRRRRESRFTPLEGDGGRPVVEPADPAAGPHRRLERAELRAALERAIDALPPAQRQVLVMRDVEGLPAAEVGRILGLGERAVKSRLHRARLAVRATLAPFVTGGDAPPPAPGCPDTARLLSRYLEGELDARVCDTLARHVSGCPSCGGACDSLRAMLGVCRDWHDAPLPDRVRDGVRQAIRAAIADVRVRS